MINLGKYDQKVVFKSYQNVTDGAGGTVPTVLTVLETFARVLQLKGSSTVEQAQMMLPKTYILGVMIRQGFEPTTAMVIEYRSKEYKIVGVEKRDERQGREYVITMIGDGN